MPEQTSLRMQEVTDLVQDLGLATTDATDEANRRITEIMAEEVATLARELAPVDTGELVRSIEVVHEQGHSMVIATADHAVFVEFGTWSHNVFAPRPGTYEIRPVRASALKFTAKDGREVFSQVVHHPGVRPQPFLNPAYAIVLDDYTEAMANMGVKLVMQT